MKKTLFGSMVLLALAAMSGCEAKTAQVPRQVEGAVSRDMAGNRVETSAMRFPRADITFMDTQLFMWKKDAQPADVAQVLNSSTLLEDTQDQLFTMLQRKNALKSEFAAIQVDVVALPGQLEELPAKQAQLAKLQGQADDLAKQLAGLNQKLEELKKQQPPTDETQQQITQVTQQIANLTKQSDKLNQKIAHQREWIEPVLAAQKAVADARLQGDFEEWKTLDAQITKKQQEASGYLQPINDLVWVFNSSPIHIGFRFDPDHTIHASIENWDLSKIDDPEIAETGAPVDFSTESFTMGHVRYETLGGVFTFEVYSPKAAYWFKIARTKYRALDGRIHYKGDIVRCSVAEGFGRPVIAHVRDFVQCGVDTSELELSPDDAIGKPVLRRGAANLVDLDVKP